MMRRRFILLLGLLCAALLSATPQGTEKTKGSKPKLLLVLVVDQFRYDYLNRFASEYTAGLARLKKAGAVFTNAYFEHFPTVTAIGHSTILSGATPSISGIVGNEWYDRRTKQQVTSVSDPSVTTLGAPGRMGASPHRLLVSTVADELKMAGRPNKSIGISIKDRSAILTVGRHADAAYWFDSATGNFVSSTYYFNDLPGWVMEFNRSRVADKYLGADWSPLSKTKDFWPAKLFGKLPTEIDKKYYDAVVKSPFGNELLVEFAERAIAAEKLGLNGGTDVLTISFSSNDAVGHDVGPDAPEVRDMAIRTDRTIGKLFDYLDNRVGMANVLVVLTADHGVAPLPEAMAKRHMPGGRIKEQEVLSVVESALNARYGEAKWLIGKSGPAPYLDHDVIRQKGLDLAEVQKTAADAMRSLSYISRVYTREQLKEGNVTDDFVSRKVRNGFHYERASDLFVVAAPYWLFQGSGTSHGTPFNYDSHVPIVFMGPGIKPGRYHQKVAVNDIAPTLATMLDVEPPAGAAGRVLTEILDGQ